MKGGKKGFWNQPANFAIGAGLVAEVRFPRYFVCHQVNFMQSAFPDFVHASSDRDIELVIDSRVPNAGGSDYKRLQYIEAGRLASGKWK